MSTPDNVRRAKKEFEKAKGSTSGLKLGTHKSRTGGLTKAGRDKINRETGSNLKPPVKAGNKSAKEQGRRKSFCSRMKGMKSKLTSKKTASDPNSRINKSLRAWDC